MADNFTMMLQDPQFTQLPIAEQQKALAAHDPQFAQMGQADIVRFVQAHQIQPQMTTTTAAGNQIPLSNTGLAPPAISLVNPAITPSSGPLDALVRYGTAEGSQLLQNLKGQLRAWQPGSFLAQPPVGGGPQTFNPFEPVKTAGYLVPQPVKDIASAIQQGNLAGAAGMVGAQATNIPIGPPTSGFGSNVRPAASLPPELQARTLTKTVNPSVNEWPSYQGAIQQELGNIKEYAQRNNIPLDSHINMAKAARGAAQEAQAVYKTQIIQPLADERVAVPAGFNGRTIGEGRTTTIGDLDARVANINNQIRSSYMKKEMGQTREALSSGEEATLVNERDSINRSLYQELSQRTGIPVDQIQALKQRFGRQYQIADQTEAAQNARESAYSKQKQGQKIPESLAQAGFQKLNEIRGGPPNIADRALASVISNTTIPASPFPNVTVQPPQLSIAPVGGRFAGGSTALPVRDFTPDISEAKSAARMSQAKKQAMKASKEAEAVRQKMRDVDRGRALRSGYLPPFEER